MAAKKKAPPADSGKLAHEVLSNLHHDSEKYAPGETVYLEPHEAERLVDAGVVKPAPAAK